MMATHNNGNFFAHLPIFDGKNLKPLAISCVDDVFPSLDQIGIISLACCFFDRYFLKFVKATKQSMHLCSK